MEQKSNHGTTKQEKIAILPAEADKEDNGSLAGRTQPMKSVTQIRILRVDLIKNENLTATYWG